MSISAIIIDHLLQLQRGDVRKLVSYWFIDDISTDASELEPMLRSLIRQLIPVPNVVPAFVREAVQNHRQAGSFLKIDELSQLVCRLVNESDRDVYMVIDGFDRTLESLLSPRRKLLLDLILNLQQSNNGNLHLLVSAKHDADICQALQHIGVNAPVLVEFGSRASSDLRSYVAYHIKHTISQLPPFNELEVLSPKLIRRIEETLIRDKSW
jgi:hypothetical protein